MEQKVFKYGTGDVIPEGAKYLTSIMQEMTIQIDNVRSSTQRLVWHYFLVEVKKES